METIISQLNEIFKDVFDNPSLVINENTTAADVEEWDSLTHIHLVVAIEKYYKIKFTSAEIQSWKKIADIANSISQKLPK